MPLLSVVQVVPKRPQRLANEVIENWAMLLCNRLNDLGTSQN